MTGLISEAAQLQIFVESEGWDFFFIGGIVVQVWGQPRLTQDIDITIFTNLSDEPAFIARVLTRFKPKFADAAEFALTHRVLPLFSKNGIGIDLTLGGLSDTSEALRRSTYQRFTNDISLRVCSAEDLVIYKAVAARPRDWIDVESVIVKQPRLDWKYIIGSLNSLSAYEEMELRIEKVEQLRTQFYRK